MDPPRLGSVKTFNDVEDGSLRRLLGFFASSEDFFIFVTESVCFIKFAVEERVGDSDPDPDPVEGGSGGGFILKLG